jgi:hypothetical protein
LFQRINYEGHRRAMHVVLARADSYSKIVDEVDLVSSNQQTEVHPAQDRLMRMTGRSSEERDRTEFARLGF